MEASTGGDLRADRTHGGERSGDGAEQLGSVGARPVGRQQPLRSRRERACDVADRSAGRRDGDHDGEQHGRCRAGGSRERRAPEQGDGDRGGRQRGDDEGPLVLVEDAAGGSADHRESDRDDDDPGVCEARVDGPVHGRLAHGRHPPHDRQRRTNSGASLAASTIPGPPTDPAPMRTTDIRSEDASELDGPRGPVTTTTDV